jgi:hypothetical protein
VLFGGDWNALKKSFEAGISFMFTSATAPA